VVLAVEHIALEEREIGRVAEAVLQQGVHRSVDLDRNHAAHAGDQQVGQTAGSGADF
jgi:hypothetical protein